MIFKTIMANLSHVSFQITPISPGTREPKIHKPVNGMPIIQEKCIPPSYINLGYMVLVTESNSSYIWNTAKAFTSAIS